MKTARQIQIETAKELQRNPAQYAPFILRMRKEAIREIKQIMTQAVCYMGASIEIQIACLTDGERSQIKMLREMFEITDDELK